MDLFISESSRGVHVPLAEELDFTLISFTFLPSFSSLSVPIKKVTDVRAIFTGNNKNFYAEVGLGADEYLSLHERDLISIILDVHKKVNAKRIFLAQDDDYQGNLMASVLYYHLIKNGIEKHDILRMPLFDGGYDYLSIGLTNFLGEETVVEMLERARMERYYINASPKIPGGVRKMYAMKYIEDHKGKPVEVAGDKSCTSTYLTKAMLDEKR